MSHRDRGSRNASGTNAQLLRAAFDDLLTDADGKGIRFRKETAWTVLGLAVAALIWAWSPKDSLMRRFGQAPRLLGKLGRGLGPSQFRRKSRTGFQAAG